MCDVMETKMRSSLLLGFLLAGFTSSALAQDVVVDVEVVAPQPVVQQVQVQPYAQPAPQPYAQPAPQPQPYAQPVPVTTRQPLPVNPAYPQPSQERRRNSVFFEGLGAGLFYSFNYERLVIPDLAVRLGVGILTVNKIFDEGRVFIATIPLTLSYLGLGSARHMFEVGGGLTVVIAGDATSGIFESGDGGVGAMGVLFAGYRLHPTGRPGFLFRAGLQAIVARGLGVSGTADSIGVLPWPYISGGLSF
jgi:hypothetical protein